MAYTEIECQLIQMERAVLPSHPSNPNWNNPIVITEEADVTSNKAVVTNIEVVITTASVDVSTAKAVVTSTQTVVTSTQAVVRNNEAIVTNSKAAVKFLCAIVTLTSLGRARSNSLLPVAPTQASALP